VALSKKDVRISELEAEIDQLRMRLAESQQALIDALTRQLPAPLPPVITPWVSPSPWNPLNPVWCASS
jgi:hypothetical protein